MDPVIAFLGILIVARCYFFTRMTKSGVCDITPQYLCLTGLITVGHFVPHFMNVSPWMLFWATFFGCLHIVFFIGEIIFFFAEREPVPPLPPTP